VNLVVSPCSPPSRFVLVLHPVCRVAEEREVERQRSREERSKKMNKFF
jgi:hypothetical protein